MNLITKCLTLCSNCFNNTYENSLEISDYYKNILHLSKHCLHISNKNDIICYKCFLNFFIYDRFIIRYLFFYLNSSYQTNYIYMKDFYLFSQRIINWHEYINHIDFILQLFHIILSSNYNNLLEKNSKLLYELLYDAFFFTAIQSNVQTNLTDQSQIFLEKFFNYLNQNKNYFKSIKYILPWGFISIHKWLKYCLLSTTNKIYQSTKIISNEFNSNLPLTFLWYITNWLVSNKVFLNEYDPIIIFEKVSRQEFITNIYDSDKHGYSIVTLCQHTYHIDGPFLMMFYCNDERIFSILLEGKLMDSTKAYGGRASLCLQISPEFFIIERGPSMLYWNIKNRSDGPLGIHIGHNGITRISLDLNMEHIHHPEGSSSINRIQIYKFGPYKTPISTPLILPNSLINNQHNEYNIFSVDAHKLAESIGIHLFT